MFTFSDYLEIFAENRKLYLKNERLQKKIALYESNMQLNNKFSAGFIVKANGDRLYENGVTITTLQQAELDEITPFESGDGRFVGTLLDLCFGEETLISASATGKAKNDMTTSKLDEQMLSFVKNQYNLRLANANDKNKRAKMFKQLVNRKIQNIRKKFMRRL